MSQLLDSLRRGGRPVLPRGSHAARRPSADAILATMGYSSSGGWWRTRSRGIAVVVTVLAAILAGWYVFDRTDSSLPPPSVAERAAPAPPSRPAAQTSVRPTPSLTDIAPAADPEPDDATQKAAPGAASARQAERGRPPRTKEQRGDDFQMAVELQRSGEFDRAARLYHGLLARDELAAQAHNNLGLIHRARGELDAARLQFEKAVERDPAYAKAHNNLGVVLLAEGRLDAAARQLRLAAELDPRDADALVNLALTEKAAGRPSQARESLLLALSMAPQNGPAHYNLAVLYDQAGEAGRAIEHYRAFLDYTGAEHASRAADVRARLLALDKSR